MILYVDKDMPANVENLVTLMTDDVRTDRINVREQISQSLERLVRQNYVARNGETYKYLTDEEQEIAQQISRVQPDAAKITSKAAQIMFRQVFENAKVTFGKNVFDVEEYLDDTRFNSASGLALRVISGVDGAPIPSREDLLLSSSRGEAIVALDAQQDYYDCLYQSAVLSSISIAVRQTITAKWWLRSCVVSSKSVSLWISVPRTLCARRCCMERSISTAVSIRQSNRRLPRI